MKRDWEALTEAEQKAVLNRAAIGNIFIASFWLALIVTLYRYFNDGAWVQSLIVGIVAIAIGAAINPDEKLAENISGRSWLRSAGYVFLLAILGAGVGSFLEEEIAVPKESAIHVAVAQEVVGDVATKFVEERNHAAEEERKETARLAKLQQQAAEQLEAQTKNEEMEVDASIARAVELLVLTNNASTDDGLWQEFCDGTNHSLAYSKYRIPAGEGVALAEYCLGLMYEYGIGTQKNIKKTIEWQLSAATHGYAQAQNDIGYKYRHGIVLPEDHKKAFYWTKLAAEQNYAKSQANLGLMYETGEGIAANLKTASYWYQKAAELGDSNGQFRLAVLYENGRGLAKNIRNAVYWYWEASKQGHVRAQFHCAELFRDGEFIQKNYEVALYLHTKAAEQGYAKSQNALGLIYADVSNESGVNDNDLAFFWFQKAAEQDNNHAQYNLGRMHARVRDHTEARYWYTKALEQGNSKAKRALDRMNEVEARQAAWARAVREDDLLLNQEPEIDCSKISNELAKLRCYTGDKNAVFADDDDAALEPPWWSAYDTSSGSTETWREPSYGGITSYETEVACNMPAFEGYEIGPGNGKHGVAIPKGDNSYVENDCRSKTRSSNTEPARTRSQ